jgi:hypothetical protein
MHRWWDKSTRKWLFPNNQETIPWDVRVRRYVTLVRGNRVHDMVVNNLLGVLEDLEKEIQGIEE